MRFFSSDAAASCSPGAPPAQTLADTPKLADYFGFQPLEIYKLERRIGNLMIRDLDGDRTGDIIVGNNARSRIDLLLSTKRPSDEAEPRPFRKEVNDLEFDKRMRLASVPVNKEVVSLATGDFNGDGKPDLVYYGSPAEVEILFNEGSGRFGGSKKIASGDAIQTPRRWPLATWTRMAATTSSCWPRTTWSSSTRQRPESFPSPAGTAHRQQSRDGETPGPGRQWRHGPGDPRRRDRSSRFMFASPPTRKSSGRSSGSRSKRPARLPSARSTATAGKKSSPRKPVRPGSGLDARRINDRRAEQVGRLVFFGLPQGSDRGRSVVVGDLDGDKRKDIVVSDPTNAQVWLYRQVERSGLSAGAVSFPGCSAAGSCTSPTWMETARMRFTCSPNRKSRSLAAP